MIPRRIASSTASVFVATSSFEYAERRWPLLEGEHFVHGISNKELRELVLDQPADARRQSSRTRRLLVSSDGCRTMSAAMRLREERFPPRPHRRSPRGGGMSRLAYRSQNATT